MFCHGTRLIPDHAQCTTRLYKIHDKSTATVQCVETWRNSQRLVAKLARQSHRSPFFAGEKQPIARRRELSPSYAARYKTAGIKVNLSIRTAMRHEIGVGQRAGP